MPDVPRDAPALLFVLGASATGKTAALAGLTHRGIPWIRGYHFDDIGVPPTEVTEREHGGPEAWQARATERWVDRLAADPVPAAVRVLEGQTRPSFVRAALGARRVSAAEIVLLDCSAEVRRKRLHGPRGQPELATERMEGWAAYLRGQADALGLRVIDTGRLGVVEVVEILLRTATDLRARVRTVRRRPPPIPG